VICAVHKDSEGPSRDILRFEDRALKALASLRPRCAADGLDRVIREPTTGQLSTAPAHGTTNVLDATYPRGYPRNHFDGCAARNLLRIARSGAHESAVSDRDSWSCSTLLVGRRSRDVTSADQGDRFGSAL
jgi:hypothetical protein